MASISLAGRAESAEQSKAAANSAQNFGTKEADRQ